MLKKINRLDLLAVILTIFNLPLSFFLIIYQCIREGKITKKRVFIISFIMAGIAFYYTPYIYADNFKYFEFFKNSSKIVLNNKVDFFLSGIMYILKKGNFSFYWTPYIFVFLTYYYFLKSFYEVSTLKKYPIKIYRVFFIIYFLNISFNDAVDGMRDYLAISLVVYGYLNIYILNKIGKGFIYLLIAPLVHFYTSIFIIIFFLEKIIKLKILKKLLILSLFGKYIIFPKTILEIIRPFLFLLSSELEYKFMVYLSSENIEILRNRVSLLGRISESLYFILAVIFPAIYIFKNKINTKLRKVILIICIFTFFSLNFYTISYRISMIILPITLINFILTYNNARYWIKYFIGIVFVLFLMHLYSYRESFFYSYVNIFKLSMINTIFENERVYVGQKQNFLIKEF